MLIALIISISSSAFAAPPEDIKTVVVRAKAKFIEEYPSNIGRVVTAKETYLVVPVSGLDFKIRWEPEVIGKGHKAPPVDLQEGREYTFHVKQSFQDDVLHILEIKVEGAVIWSAYNIPGRK